MGAISNRADRLVGRVLKLQAPGPTAVPEQQEGPKPRRIKTLLADLAKRRRRLLRTREGL